MTGPDYQTPPPRPAPASAWDRLVRSKRVWMFFIAATVVMAIGVVTVSNNKRMRDWFFADDPPTQINLSEGEMNEAVETLIKVFRIKLVASLQKMQEYQLRADDAQRNKLKAMKEEDAKRKQQIADGVWPSKEHPNPAARYFDRIDVDPAPIALTRLMDIEAMDFVTVYKNHIPLEREVGQLFERFHALELSASLDQPLPLSKSLENTKLDLPKRKKIRSDFMQTAARNREELEKFRKEITELYLETQDMLNSAARWVELAESKTGSLTSGATLFGLTTKIVPAPEPYYGHYLNPRFFKPTDLKQLFDVTPGLGTRIGEGDLQAKAVWMSPDRWYYIGPFAHPTKARGSAQRRTEDLYFKYPPESSVDLGATYTGRDGRTLTWKYRVIGRNDVSQDVLGKPADKGLRIMPYTVDNDAYAIWYFYTEVWSDQDRTVVASFASDDFGQCWVNGTLVYQSPSETQPWVPFTRNGFRPVLLRKGYNRVLFKLENWTGSTGFSTLFMTYEDKKLLKMIEEEARRQ